MSAELEALARADFDWVRTLDSVWSDADPSAGGPNEQLVVKIVGDLLKEASDLELRPKGRVLIGQAGVGKTHLVGRLRRGVWARGGWFVLLDVLGLQDFWRSAALSFLTALQHRMPDGRRQLEAVLAGVARHYSPLLEEQVEAAFQRPDIGPAQLADIFRGALRKVDEDKALKHGDVFRALCFLRSQDYAAAALAHSWLQGYDADIERRRELGFLTPPPAPAQIVAGLSWIMGIAGPTLVVLDQIDGVIDSGRVSFDDAFDGGSAGLAAILAGGLTDLHDVRCRGMTVLACLDKSWDVLRSHGPTSFEQRFPHRHTLVGMNDAKAAAGMIAARLAPAFAAAGFVPPYPTWPFSERVIAEAAKASMMPRTMLMRCDAFRQICVTAGAVRDCASLTEPMRPPMSLTPTGVIDIEGARQRAEVPKLDEDHEAALGRLLRDAFDLYALEGEPDEAVDVASKGDPDQRIPPLHGRLTFTYREENDRERHVCYRALTHGNAIAFQARLRAALTSSGISTRIAGRELVVIRRGPVPGGAKTAELVGRFVAAGGLMIDPSDEDLRTFAALRDLAASASAAGQRDTFVAWLRRERPIRATAFFRAAKLGPEEQAPSTPALPTPSLPEPTQSQRNTIGAQATAALEPERPRATAPTSFSTPVPASPDAIPVGRRLAPGGDRVGVPLRALPRHTAIIAGSGSGKTVLLRRIVEEAALAGVPAIVIDPNNDLSRLGDPWPERPDVFTAEDEAKARAYATKVEVVVWTPGTRAGNPLVLSVLPDFAALGADPDEREAAVEMAAETLRPLIGARTTLQRGVLADALQRFASHGGGDLRALASLLGDLPDGVSLISGAGKIAAALADGIHAAMATNPLLRGVGVALDPSALFFGSDRAKTRISVVNLSGLASDAAREDFVNRLQMALFGWIKKHASPHGMLYVIDEAQTFLPSGKGTLSLGSGLKLAAQARKYGLGLIVATQVPRGIHNQIVANCTTTFLGRQTAPATIAAAQAIAAAQGGDARDIGRLARGQFYFATEGSGRPAKIETPLCLTHHPANPPSPEDVVERARRTRVA